MTSSIFRQPLFDCGAAIYRTGHGFGHRLHITVQLALVVVAEFGFGRQSLFIYAAGEMLVSVVVDRGRLRGLQLGCLGYCRPHVNKSNFYWSFLDSAQYQ